MEDDLSTASQLPEAIAEKLNISKRTTFRGGVQNDAEQRSPSASSDALGTTKQQHFSTASSNKASLLAGATPAITTTPTCGRPTQNAPKPPIILCDMGYGLPKEARPRKEKLLAISRQLVNFLKWQTKQQQQQQQQHSQNKSSTSQSCCCCCCEIRVVACPDQATADALQRRILELWKKECPSKDQEMQLPTHFSISTQRLEEWCMLVQLTAASKNDNNESLSSSASSSSDNDDLSAPMPIVYLSPDAENTLDVHQDPPPIVVIGLLIDRRIQLNRSIQRASKLTMPVARWPLENLHISEVVSLDPNEPLNVDCILEGMQQWYWNCAKLLDDVATIITVVGYDGKDDTQRSSTPLSSSSSSSSKARCFQDAAIQALRHHQERHPERPQHIIHKSVSS